MDFYVCEQVCERTEIKSEKDVLSEQQSSLSKYNADQFQRLEGQSLLITKFFRCKHYYKADLTIICDERMMSTNFVMRPLTLKSRPLI